jgi:hypothetical protein
VLPAITRTPLRSREEVIRLFEAPLAEDVEIELEPMELVSIPVEVLDSGHMVHVVTSNWRSQTRRSFEELLQDDRIFRPDMEDGITVETARVWNRAAWDLPCEPEEFDRLLNHVIENQHGVCEPIAALHGGTLAHNPFEQRDPHVRLSMVAVIPMDQSPDLATAHTLGRATEARTYAEALQLLGDPRFQEIRREPPFCAIPPEDYIQLTKEDRAQRRELFVALITRSPVNLVGLFRRRMVEIAVSQVGPDNFDISVTLLPTRKTHRTTTGVPRDGISGWCRAHGAPVDAFEWRERGAGTA